MKQVEPESDPSIPHSWICDNGQTREIQVLSSNELKTANISKLTISQIINHSRSHIQMISKYSSDAQGFIMYVFLEDYVKTDKDRLLKNMQEHCSQLITENLLNDLLTPLNSMNERRKCKAISTAIFRIQKAFKRLIYFLFYDKSSKIKELMNQTNQILTLESFLKKLKETLFERVIVQIDIIEEGMKMPENERTANSNKPVSYEILKNFVRKYSQDKMPGRSEEVATAHGRLVIIRGLLNTVKKLEETHLPIYRKRKVSH